MQQEQSEKNSIKAIHIRDITRIIKTYISVLTHSNKQSHLYKYFQHFPVQYYH